MSTNEKVTFDVMREGVPYLSYDRWLVDGHYYGELWLRNSNYELETCIVTFQLGEVGARELNRREGANTYRAGDMSHRFITKEVMVRHAKRIAEAIWGWTGDLDGCYSMSGYQKVTHHEQSLGTFTTTSTWTGRRHTRAE